MKAVDSPVRPPANGGEGAWRVISAAREFPDSRPANFRMGRHAWKESQGTELNFRSDGSIACATSVWFTLGFSCLQTDAPRGRPGAESCMRKIFQLFRRRLLPDWTWPLRLASVEVSVKCRIIRNRTRAKRASVPR